MHLTQNITHIITGLEGGGAEGALYRLLQHEQRARATDNRAVCLQHRVISLTDDGVFGQPLRELGVPVDCVGMRRGRVSLRGMWRLYRLLRGQARADLVQTWMYHADFLGGLAARAAGIRRVVWGIRHSNLDPAHTGRAVRLVARACAWLSRRGGAARQRVVARRTRQQRGANLERGAKLRGRRQPVAVFPAAMISCSARAADEHRRIGYADRFAVVPNGYDLAQLQPDPEGAARLRRDWGIPAGAALVGMVGRYNPQKNHAGFLDALAKLPESVHCVLVGSGCDAGNPELVGLIAARGLQGRVVLAGRRSDIPAVMSALDLHVLSSSSGEAFPNVLAEAMACGTPAVTTDVGDAAAIAGDAGWVVPPGDAAALAAAIRQGLDELQQQPEQRSRRVAAGMARVREQFSIAGMSEGFRRVWSGLLRRDLLLVAPSMRGGGAERVLSLLARGLDRELFRVSLALVQAEGPFLADIPEDVEIIDLGARRARYAAGRLLRLLRREQPDAVLSTLGHLNLLIAMLRPLLPRRTRLYAREANTVSMSLQNQAHPCLMRLLYRRWYRRFDRVICQSRYMARDLVSNYRVPAERTVVIHNPVDAGAVRTAAAEAGASGVASAAGIGAAASGAARPEAAASKAATPGAAAHAHVPPAPDSRPAVLRAIAVGRLAPQKGYDLLLQALQLVQRPVQLRILGTGTEEAGLRELASGLPAHVQVVFAGFSSAPAAEMAAADVLLLPSRYEGLPNVVLEAGVLGLPVLAFDCPGGTAEIVHPGITGELIPCGDTAAFATALEGFAPSRYDSAQIAAQTAARFALAAVSRQYEAVLLGSDVWTDS
ncbi:glycosyltransferase [Spirochaeta africana]|uniref:Glycosyltransferase n=1 Tax=Spirochaeta africana (strain ATCC 700263 / DSM 8902 / Z-7692) TaxID=889378 RepID=H9UF75_SPIAZ|nr:glycosyltransferase [Spirochaeta africana]AFG36168.1 glycosyltransferase [Spirochaeta africana DSM 8902]